MLNYIVQLAFAQVTFSNNTSEFAEVSSRLRSILDGNYEIEWNSRILGFWDGYAW